MIKEIEFKKDHLTELIGDIDFLVPAESSFVSATFIDTMTKKPRFCGGIFHLGGENHAWAAFNSPSMGELVTISRRVKETLKWQTSSVFMVVHADFVEGIRWAKVLGFKLHSEIKEYFNDGAKALRFVRESEVN